MSRRYKNILKLRDKAYGTERRANLTKEILKDSSPFPNPLEYKDIDEEFKRWVNEDLEIVFNGERLPTFALFSNQRFGEYMQSWEHVDDKKNVILNFKTVTRENNPKGGTLNGNTKNIPGERTYLMKRVSARDRNNRKYYIDYRVKQPFTVDLMYSVGLMTNKYELLNSFNQKMNEKFKAINCYIRPKGHFIPMELNDISDESEYSIDDRQFYSQTYSIKVMGYIMPEDSFIVEEIPSFTFKGFEGDQQPSYAEIEDLPCDNYTEEEYKNIPVALSISISPCDNKYCFNIDCGLKVESIRTENIRSFKTYVNDTEVKLDTNLILNPNDRIKIKSVYKYNNTEDCKIFIEGIDPYRDYNTKDNIETETNIINDEEC